jgi:glycosyltransferase involved in cell wall biosynthesis
MNKGYHFEDVTLLITHYNRSSSLARLVNALNELGCSFEEIVVSDDGSAAPYLQEVRRLADTTGFRLVESPINKGLGNNINKGQRAV